MESIDGSPESGSGANNRCDAEPDDELPRDLPHDNGAMRPVAPRRPRARLSMATRIGLISDTHGLLRDEAAGFLRGCDLVVHAGDICDRAVLDALAAIAPTIAVRGNNDRGAWAEALRESELVEVGGIVLYAIHDIAAIDLDPRAAGVRVVVSGHSHKPGVEERDGVLFVNPGSAGPRRFSLPISIAELVIDGGDVSVRFAQLADRRP